MHKAGTCLLLLTPWLALGTPAIGTYLLGLTVFHPEPALLWETLVGILFLVEWALIATVLMQMGTPETETRP